MMSQGVRDHAAPGARRAALTVEPAAKPGVPRSGVNPESLIRDEGRDLTASR